MDFRRVFSFVRSYVDVIVVLLASIVTYFNALGGGFVWDDKQLIVTNPYINQISYWFTNFYLSTKDQVTSHFYRPFSGLSFWLDAKIWGLEQPGGFHLTNLIAFAATCVLLLLLVRRLTGSRAVAMVSALLFAVHPVHSEVVAWISGRTDLFCGLFLLISIWTFILWRDTNILNYKLASIAAFATAMFTKEVAIIGLPFLLATMYLPDLKHEKEKLSYKIKSVAPHLIVVLIYLAARQMVMAHSAAAVVAPTFEPAPFSARLAGAPVNVFRYLAMIFVPTAADPYHSATTLRSVASPAFIASMVGVISVLTAAFCLRKRSPLVFWSTIWFFAALLPAINIIQLPGTTMAERFIYLPSIGVFLIIGISLASIYRLARAKAGIVAAVAGPVLVAAVLVYMLAITWQGNSNWNNEYNLWTSTVKRHPNLAYARNGLGSALNERALEDEAIEEYRKALEIDPNFTGARLNLACVLSFQGRYDEAEVEYLKVIKENPKHPAVYRYYAQTLMVKTPPQVKEAIQVLEQGVSACPKRTELAFTLAELYLDQGTDIKRAVELLEGIIRLSPDAELARLDLAKAYVQLGRKDDARKQVDWLLKYSPSADSEPVQTLKSLLEARQ